MTRPCACGCGAPVNPAGGRRYVDGRHRRAAFEKRHPRVDQASAAQLEEARLRRLVAEGAAATRALIEECYRKPRPGRPQRRVWLPPDAWALVELRAEEAGERPSAYVARLVREHEEFLMNLARAVAGGAHARQRP